MLKLGNTIYIRNVDAATLAKIDEIAKAKGISRNKIVNSILDNYVLSDKVKEIDEKYSQLVSYNIEAVSSLTTAVEHLQDIIIKKEK